MEAMTGFNVVIIEQDDNKPFNRGSLANAAFKIFNPDYLCVHDVDMIPIDANYFSEADVTHLATKVEQFGFKMPYPNYLGGVTIFKNSAFKDINGFSNKYKGWGAEDDDIRSRLMINGYQITRTQNTFKSLPHTKAYKQSENELLIKRNRMIYERWFDYLDSGLSDLGFDYTVVSPNHIKVKLYQ